MLTDVLKTENNPQGERFRNNELIKSPSDTTIYAPLLQKSQRADNEIIDQISNFVESVRVSQDGKANRHRSDFSTFETPTNRVRPRVQSMNNQHFDRMLVNEQHRMKAANEAGERAIVEAEKYKITTDTPQGMISQIDLRCLLDNGDDFFYVTCHVDPSLKEKIEKGEFVDLEKLMPRSKPGGYQQNAEGSHMEWITHDGMTYLAPVQEKESKINGIRRWEQAFHVYAAIYTKANPDRASEIWQYCLHYQYCGCVLPLGQMLRSMITHSDN